MPEVIKMNYQTVIMIGCLLFSSALNWGHTKWTTEDIQQQLAASKPQETRWIAEANTKRLDKVEAVNDKLLADQNEMKSKLNLIYEWVKEQKEAEKRGVK